MGIQDWSENIILVNLEPEPQLGEELKTVTRIARDRRECNAVIDFTNAEMVTSSSLAQLLRLQKTLRDKAGKLILCGLSKRTKGIFVVTGLETVFDFAEEQFVALASFQMTV